MVTPEDLIVGICQDLFGWTFPVEFWFWIFAWVGAMVITAKWAAGTRRAARNARDHLARLGGGKRLLIFGAGLLVLLIPWLVTCYIAGCWTAYAVTDGFFPGVLEIMDPRNEDIEKNLADAPAFAMTYTYVCAALPLLAALTYLVLPGSHDGRRDTTHAVGAVLATPLAVPGVLTGALFAIGEVIALLVGAVALFVGGAGQVWAEIGLIAALIAGIALHLLGFALAVVGPTSLFAPGTRQTSRNQRV